MTATTSDVLFLDRGFPGMSLLAFRRLKTSKNLVTSGTATPVCAIHRDYPQQAVPQASLLPNLPRIHRIKSFSTCSNEKYRTKYTGIWIGLYSGSPDEIRAYPKPKTNYHSRC